VASYGEAFRPLQLYLDEAEPVFKDYLQLKVEVYSVFSLLSFSFVLYEYEMLGTQFIKVH